MRRDCLDPFDSTACLSYLPESPLITGETPAHEYRNAHYIRAGAGPLRGKSTRSGEAGYGNPIFYPAGCSFTTKKRGTPLLPGYKMVTLKTGVETYQCLSAFERNGGPSCKLTGPFSHWSICYREY